MRMPGFVTEASLYKASELRAADGYQKPSLTDEGVYATQKRRRMS